LIPLIDIGLLSLEESAIKKNFKSIIKNDEM